MVSVGTVLAACLWMSGCKDDIEEMKLSPEEKTRVLALQNPFGKNLVRLTNAASGADVLIGLKRCRAYRAALEHSVVTEWLRIEEVTGRNLLAGGGCNSQNITFDGKHVYLDYCATAIGAGGGCGGGAGEYRSANGRDWERKSKGVWVPVKKADLPPG